MTDLENQHSLEHRKGRGLFSTSGLLVFIVLAGFLVRGAALWQSRDIKPVLDEILYLQRAHGLLDGKGHLGSFQSWVRHPEQVWPCFAWVYYQAETRLIGQELRASGVRMPAWWSRSN